MNEFRQNQISFLVKTSAIFGKMASILEANPDALFKPYNVHRNESLMEQMQERELVGGMIKKSYEDNLVLLTEVYPFIVNFI
jgi:hypothetical protein